VCEVCSEAVNCVVCEVCSEAANCVVCEVCSEVKVTVNVNH